MHLLLTILAFFVIFSLLILIHEFGHFYAAKRSGVKVEEFGFGLPPRIWGVQKGETLYSVNWIPFGGFVRTLGEDGTKEGRTNKRSLYNQPLRVQAFIVCAGVIMNLLLSFVLLTGGFLLGIEPLMATEEDFLNNIRTGVVQLESGAEEDASDLVYVPRLIYQDRSDTLFDGILQTGDILLSAQQKILDPTVESMVPYYRTENLIILSEEDLYKALEQLSSQPEVTEFSFSIYRSSQGVLDVTVPFTPQNPVISMIETGSPAQGAGLQVGDSILSVGGQPVRTSQQVVEYTQTQKVQQRDAGGLTEAIEYVIQRPGEEASLELTIPLRPEDERIGVGLSDLLPYYGNLSFYSSYVPEHLLGIQKLQYGWKAPLVAVQEMWRLGKMTASTFMGVLGQFVTAQGVPEGVSGPVGIAQMTGVTLNEGFAAMLRFVALLSLSLGVINILPLPALDGGHFALLVYQAVSGKKPNPKYAQLIHTAGMFFLLIFIVYVSFHDVMNLL